MPPLKTIYHFIDEAGRLNPILRLMAQSLKEQKVGARMIINGMIKSVGLYHHYYHYYYGNSIGHSDYQEDQRSRSREILLTP